MELKVGNKVKLNDLGVMFVNMVGDNHDDNYEGKIVEVKENTYGESYLVQFPKGFDGHDGNGRSEKVYEDNNVMFLPDIALELIEDEEVVTDDEIDFDMDGVQIKIVYDGSKFQIVALNGTTIIVDGHVNALGGVVEALYDLIGVEFDD